MCRQLLAASVALILMVTTGCATLVARKVSLPDRLQGCDGHTKGFRYYVSRPHLVVNRQVPILQTVDYGLLIKACPIPKDAKHPGEALDLTQMWTGAPYAIRTTSETGAKLIYDTAGEPLPAEMASLQFNTVTKAMAAASPAGSPASLGSLLGTSFADASPAPKPADNIDAIQIAYLPDFEEQMAIRHINFLAHGKFALNFRDGWQLKSLTGNFDSTEVPVQILKTLQTAIGDASAVAQQRLKTRGGAPSAASEQDARAKPLAAQKVVIIRTRYIDPGIYRLTKASERSGGRGPAGLGILADMGIPVYEDVKVQLLANSGSADKPAADPGKPAADPAKPAPTPGQQPGDETPKLPGPAKKGSQT